jgi:ABC-type transport system involved in multi-copper enzyme maturation permease subunit
MSPALLPLLRKELIQLRRSRRAMITAIVLPAIFLLYLPLSQGAVFGAMKASPKNFAQLPGALSRLGDPRVLFKEVMLPFYLLLAGAIAPTSFAIQTVLVERERRSLELLMALPVTVAEILAAKIGAMLAVSFAVMVPLAVIDGIVLGLEGVVDPLYAALLVVLLLASLSSSIGTVLLTALLSKDFRTAQNLAGLFSLPFLLVAAVPLCALTAPWNLLALTALLLAATAGSIYIALTRLTFERYLA